MLDRINTCKCTW